MKKLLLLFAALCCTIVTNAANSDATKVEYETGKYMYFILDGATHTASVTWGGDEAYSGTANYVGEIVIPGSITYAGGQYDVTSIGNNAFRKCTSLTSVSLPEGLASIGDRAFFECSGYVGELVIPSSVASIGVDALNGIKGTITLEGSVKDVGESAFAGCTGLTSITVSGSIGEDAFSGCTNLKSVTLKDGCSLGKYALSGFTGTITVEGSVKDVGLHAFDGCKGLTSITVSGNIGKLAFNDCANLKSITLKDGCSLGNYALSSFTGTITAEGSVKDVGEGAFAGCTGLTSITVSGSIGREAFSGCTNLTLTLKDGCSPGYLALNGFTGTITAEGCVKNVGERAFTGCTGLTTITVTGNIGGKAFDGCTNLTLTLKDGCSLTDDALNGFTGPITIEGTLKDVGERALQGCTGLTSISVSGNIDELAFNGCTNLISIIVSGNLRTRALYGCPNTTTITLKDGCNFSDRALKDFKGTIIIEGSVKDVGAGAFAGCTGLTAITVSGNIGEKAFDGCTNLTLTLKEGCNLGDDALNGFTGTIILEGTLKDVGERSFAGCTGLTSITVSGSIGEDAFSGCTNLKSVILKDGCSLGDNALNGFTGTIILEGTLKDVGAKAFAGCTGFSAVSVGERIGGKAFNGCTNLKSITLKDGCSLDSDALNGYTGTITIEGTLKDVGERALQGCTALASISVSGSIGVGAFIGCANLKFITLKDGCSLADDVLNGFTGTITVDGSLKNVGARAFAGCTGLSAVSVSGSIGDNAFNGCIGLASLTISNSVTSIGSFAFAACTGLTSLTIPNSVTSIGGNAFVSCTGLTSLIIQNGVESIGWGAFAGCTGLTSLTIPNSVTSIGGSAFVSCTGLTSLIIQNGVESIGGSAFAGCTGLTSLTIPNSVESIGESAFAGCTGLTSLTIPNSVESIGISVFEGCTGLTSLTIPNSVKSIGKWAFKGCTGLKSIYAMPITPPALEVTPYSEAFNGVHADIPVYVPDVQAYFRSDWGKYFTQITANLVFYKTKALGDIDAAMQEATLAEDEKAAVEAQVNIINGVADDAAVTEANIAIVQNARSEALAIINRDKCRTEKDAAIAALTALVNGASDAHTTGVLQNQINAINAAATAQEVNIAQDKATEQLNSALAIAHSFLGTLGTKQNGPAVRVTDRDGKEVILYAPKKVEYIKVNEI